MELDSTSELIHVLYPTQFLSKLLRKYTELAETHARTLTHARIHTTHSLIRESSQRAVHNKGQTDISCALINGI